jgi:biopolymer transport protein ExbD
MPIQFRCSNCRQTLSITRRKAGREVECPACGASIMVPTLESLDSSSARAAAAPDDAATELAAADDLAPVDESLPAGELHAHSARSAHVEEEEEGFRIRRRSAEEGGLDMTPMVDVTFQLLIFFMLTASFSVQKSMQSEAPEPDQEGAAQTISQDDLERNSVIVEIDAENRILVDGDPVPGIDGLVDVLTAKAQAESPPKNELLIEADYRASHGTVVSVTDAGMSAQMQRIRRVSRRAED